VIHALCVRWKPKEITAEAINKNQLAAELAIMDPLSISVGILTILGAVSASTKAIKALHSAPKEFQALAEELDQITNVANHIKILTGRADFADVNLSLCLSRTYIKLENAQATIEKRLAQRGRRDVFPLRQRLREKSRVVQLTEDLKSMRHDLMATFGILGLSVTPSTAECTYCEVLLLLT